MRARTQRARWANFAIAPGVVDRPFVVDSPDDLRTQLRVLAARLRAGAEAPSTGATFEPDLPSKAPTASTAATGSAPQAPADGHSR